MTNSSWTLSETASPRVDWQRVAVLIAVGLASWGLVLALYGAATACL